jgi:ribonuclease-3
LAIADLLLSIHETAKEGELSKMRAALVNTQTLASIAETIDLSPYIRLSRGELAQGGAKKPSILADVFEAIIGAVYREAGFEPAKICVSKVFGQRLALVAPRDPKTELQETLHIRQMKTAEYLLECVEGPEHAPNFVSIVKIDNIIYGRGKGTSKKASQQEAAAEALQKILDSQESK